MCNQGVINSVLVEHCGHQWLPSSMGVFVVQVKKRTTTRRDHVVTYCVVVAPCCRQWLRFLAVSIIQLKREGQQGATTAPLIAYWSHLVVAGCLF